jgi:hypothetical protein
VPVRDSGSCRASSATRTHFEEIEADYWLLVHPDLKAVPRVRHVMERIRGVFKASRAALRG